jgi:hypothetical protein
MRARERENAGVLVLGAVLTLMAWVPYGFPGEGVSSGKDIDERLQPYLKVLHDHGQEPVRFVLEKLARHDLLIFDDAVHSAVEPFDCYQQLIHDGALSASRPRSSSKPFRSTNSATWTRT